MSLDALLRSVFEQAPIGMAVVGMDGRCREANHALSQLLGYRRSELARLSLFDLTHPDDAAVSALQRRRLQDGTAQSFAVEKRYLRKDGSPVWVLLTVSLVRATERTPQYYIAQLQDISERRGIADTLARYAEEIEDLYQNAPCGYHSVDAEGLIVRINDTELRWLGYAREEVAGRLRTYDLLAPESRAAYESGFRRLRESGELSDLELVMVRKDGSRLEVSLNATAIRDAAGNYNRSRSTVHDISERRRIQAQLAAEGARNAALLRTAGDGMLILDRTARVRDVNHAMCRMLGHTREALLAMHPSQWDIGFSLLELREMLAPGRPQGHVFEAEWRNRDGTPVEVEIHATRVTLDGEGLLYMSARDIGERKNLARREGARGRVLEMLAHGAPLAQLLGVIAESVEYERPDCHLAIFVLDAAHGRLVLTGAAALPQTLREALAAPDGAAEDCPAALAVRRCEAVMIDHLGPHAQRSARVRAARQAGYGALWALPLLSPKGKVLGVLSVYLRRALARSDAPLTALLGLAGDLASVAILRRQSEERLQLAGHVYQSSSEGILVTDADDRIVAVNPAFSVLTGYAAEEVVGRNPKFLASGETPPETYVAMRTALREGGRWQGELYNRRKNGELFVEWLRINTVYDENGDVLRRIGLFSDITEKKKSDQLVWHQANFDPLTGLPNRRLFRDRLLQEMRRSERSGQLLALLFIDLDKFKAVNDRLGHETGDRLLAEAAQRISECVRSTDTVARLGGDEFTLVLPGIGGAPQIERVAHALITRLEKEFRFGAESAHISASVGVALYAGDATSMDTLIARADAAMYAAKSAGRSCFRYYTDDTPAGDSPPAVAAAGSAQGEPVMHGGTACRA